MENIKISETTRLLINSSDLMKWTKIHPAPSKSQENSIKSYKPVKIESSSKR